MDIQKHFILKKQMFHYEFIEFFMLVVSNLILLTLSFHFFFLIFLILFKFKFSIIL